MPYSRPTTVKRQPRSLLCGINEAEEWQLENKYLIGHYRTASNSYRASLASLGYLHNQTGNVYTHLIGAALFLAWAVQTFNDILQRYPTSNWNDFLAFGVFFACALFCFGSSALFHLFMHQSAHVNQIWLLFDLYGVFALIIATVFSGTYYGFYCERFWWEMYSGGIMSVTSACALFCSRPQFRHIKWRNVRAVLFVTIGCYGVLPMTHLVQQWGRLKANEMIGWNLMFWEGMCYFLGAAVYAFRVPERWNPGRFDIWGASHQIFHVCAVIGAALHYKGLLKGFDYNHGPSSRQCQVA